MKSFYSELIYWILVDKESSKCSKIWHNQILTDKYYECDLIKIDFKNQLLSIFD